LDSPATKPPVSLDSSPQQNCERSRPHSQFRCPKGRRPFAIPANETDRFLWILPHKKYRSETNVLRDFSAQPIMEKREYEKRQSNGIAFMLAPW